MNYFLTNSSLLPFQMLSTDNSYRTCLTASVTTHPQLTHRPSASPHRPLKPEHRRHFLRASPAIIYPLAWSDLNRNCHKVQLWRRWSLASPTARMAVNKRFCIITSTNRRLKCRRYGSALIRPRASIQLRLLSHRAMSLLLLRGEVPSVRLNFHRAHCWMGAIWRECLRWAISIARSSHRRRNRRKLRDWYKKLKRKM